MWLQALAAVGLAWYLIVVLVISLGIYQLQKQYSKPTPRPTSPCLPLAHVPHVTVIRPVRGIEPYLYECLASTFQQKYPASKLTVYFCIESRDDEAYAILARLHADYGAAFDFEIYVEQDDPYLHGEHGRTQNLGPNPKIRNMSRAYREAKGNLVWIIDCNVWVSASVCGLMVDRLCGFGAANRGRKYKFVHQLPLVVDVSQFYGGKGDNKKNDDNKNKAVTSYAGGLLDELFLSTSHAKFYTAISTAALAPCTVGKSNMFRRSHLTALTSASTARPPGIDFFSHNICEDHLISDLLWRSPLPASIAASADQAESGGRTLPLHHLPRWGNHALVLCPPCIQPLAHVSLASYVARRARWLRVRKFTVPVATLVEPGTEALLGTTVAVWGLLTLLAGISQEGRKGEEGEEGMWRLFWLGGAAALWLVGVVAWAAVDYWLVWRVLQGWAGEEWKDNENDNSNINANDNANSDSNSKTQTRTDIPPPFVGSAHGRGFATWLAAWLGRELLAWPVWAWAVLGGTEVIWRGRRFWVGWDMRVHALFDDDDKRGEREGGEGKKEL